MPFGPVFDPLAPVMGNDVSLSWLYAANNRGIQIGFIRHSPVVIGLQYTNQVRNRAAAIRCDTDQITLNAVIEADIDPNPDVQPRKDIPILGAEPTDQVVIGADSYPNPTVLTTPTIQRRTGIIVDHRSVEESNKLVEV